jgi:adenylosuccinate lyase
VIQRYSRPEMVALWEPEAKLERWRDVELAALAGMVRAKVAPRKAFYVCTKKAGRFTAADVDKIETIEKTTRHDVIAFLTFMEERIGPEARWLHFGMTSSDVLDTALAMTLRDAADVLEIGLKRCLSAVKKRAREFKNTPMIGRSHGIHAEPTTFGHKLALWYSELTRDLERLERARDVIAVGKISGAVGTFAHLPPSVEKFACKTLGLTPAPISSQVVSRDRHAEYFQTLALIASSIEGFAVEVRHLQRTEVREAEEPFTPGQKGSSAMPHKRNPILSENLTGLARLMRGWASAASENVALWHERDISHSSVERVIGPDATVTLDFMLHRFAHMVENLKVYPERMLENLALTGGVWNSQTVLLELAKKGVDRQAAYVIVQRAAMRWYEEKKDFQSALLDDAELGKHLSKTEIEECFSMEHHGRNVDAVFERVFGTS